MKDFDDRYPEVVVLMDSALDTCFELYEKQVKIIFLYLFWSISRGCLLVSFNYIFIIAICMVNVLVVYAPSDASPSLL